MSRVFVPWATIGFAWRLGHALPGHQGGWDLPRLMFVDWTYVATLGLQDGWIRRPVRWRFPVPESDPDSAAERFGASQVRGLFGGVRSARLARLSEEAERVIGDVITYGLCEVLDFLKKLEEGDGEQVKVDNVQFVILGAALPKVVGRLASLRLDPVRIRVAWFCPVPIPKWISERADEFLLIPPEHLREESEAGENWEEERLVRGWCTKRGEKLLLVQQLTLLGAVRAQVGRLGMGRSTVRQEYASKGSDRRRWPSRKSLQGKLLAAGPKG